MSNKILLAIITIIAVLLSVGSALGITATGGTETVFTNASGSFKVHTFKSNGTLDIVGTGNFTLLVIAGGGGGGGTLAGNGGAAGGGAGGLVYINNMSVAPGTYTITVGAGGAGGASATQGVNGQNSSFNGLVNAVGGGGGSRANGGGNPGNNGGSGGGAYYTAAPGNGTTGQGFNGSKGCNSALPYYGGGGGGSGTEGVTAACAGTPGHGGNGTTLLINGSAVVYAGGGGGGNNGQTGYTSGSGGTGGGGKGANVSAVAGSGTANTGGGGGGGAADGSGNSSNYAGGGGGSGIVIIQYQLPSVISVIASLYNIVNSTNWNESVSFYNVSGILTFDYFNITRNGYCVTMSGNGTATNCTSNNGNSEFYNVTNTTTVTNSVVVTAGTYQSLINLNAYRLFSPATVSSFSALNNKVSNSTTTGTVTLYALNGTNNLGMTVTGNTTENVTCTVTAPLTTTTCTATRIYDNLYTIGAKFGGASVSSFTVGVFNSTLGGTLYNASTTNGSLVFPLLQGYTYVFSLNASNYTRQSVSLPANATTHLYNFTLLASRQVSFIFRDEITRNIINSTNMTLEVISELYATNLSTTNGTLLDKILTFPTEYTFRYRGGTYTERQYFLNVTDETNTNLTLYAIELNQSDLVTVTVSDTGGNLLEGSTVKLLRYFLYCNCYEVVEMERTGPDGTANVWVQPIEGHYKWSIDYAGVNYFVSSSPETIITTEKYFSVELGQDYYAAYRALSQVGTVITLNTSTGVIAYTWSDPSGVVTSACLTTYRYIGILENLYNSSCDDGATGGVITMINTTDGRRYKYVASVNVTSSNIDSVIYTGFYDAPFGYDFGTTGQFLSLIVVVVLAIVFSFSVAAVLVSVGVSLVVLTALGLMTFSTGFIAGAVAVLLGIGIFLVRR